ncbi:MAG: hypothetical protein GF330_11620 [Candidatus Eisenbacteria bacterium]|nr:hypothetical protein [Candidatus Eisenbacteria bacterium]
MGIRFRLGRSMMGALLALACTGMGVGAETLRVDLDFEAPVLRPTGDAAVRVEAPGCVTFADPGAPLLPAREAAVLLPPGETVTAVRVVPAGTQGLPGTHRVAHAETPRPISLPGPFPPTLPDASIYESEAAFPPEAAHLVTEQIAWGHGIAFFQVHPVVYAPLSGRLSWHERVTLEITTASRAGLRAGSPLPNLRHTPATRARVAAMVMNEDLLDRYAGREPATVSWSRLDPDHYPYVIVTAPEFADTFAELALYASGRGLRATVVTLDQIATYPGDDEAMQVRNFVIDAYQNWGTEYVVLGGDYDIVPIRNLYVDAGGTIDAFPGDCYYEGLDGTWNDDGDDRWGEEGEYDLAGELAVGRVSISHTGEFAPWFHKNRMYVEQPVVAEIQKGLFLGERMDDHPTWGGDYMDELKDYCCTHGYCTSGYPDDYLKETLYDRDGTWSKWDVIALFNEGFPTSHHLGHSGTTYCMKMDSGDVQYFTNDGITHSYAFMSSQGCYDNNFDNAGTDAIAETFLFDEHAAAAFLGNTRYGWYVIGGTGGPSQHYDRQFVDARYEEGIATIGWMNVDSKTDNIWMINPWNLWCHYELCLMGDPALPQWDELQGTLEVAHSGGYVMGQGDYAVTVTCEGAPVEGATVTLYSADLEVWASAVSGPDGVAEIAPDPQGPMTLDLKAVKVDYLPATSTVEVAPPSGPWLVWQATAIDDDDDGVSMGDGDGLADLGETLQLLVTLQNVGPEDALNTTITLACEDPRIEVLDGEAAYGTIPAGGSGANTDDLIVRVATDIADGDLVECDLTIACDERWSGADDFTLTLHAPILSVAGWAIDDSVGGDGEGDLDPGESFDLQVTLANSGSDEGRGITAELSCWSFFLELDLDQSALDLVPCDGEGAFAPPFHGRLDILIPTDQVLHMVLNGETWAGQPFTLEFDVPVASLFEDGFEAEAGWQIGAPDDDATAGIWTRVDPIGTYFNTQPVAPEDDHSPLGTHCFVTEQGEPGRPARESDVDAGKTTLFSPALDLSTAVRPRLIYWRWYTNDIGPYGGQDYWQVDVSPDGGQSWVNLEYTNESLEQWQRHQYYLEDHIALTDNVVLRFIASDYDGDSLVEAALDDVSIESQPDPAAVEEEEGATQRPLSFRLGAIAPSPLRLSRGGVSGAALIQYDLPQAGEARLEVFGVDGGLVRTLAGGRHEAGAYRASWDGRDAGGRELSSGVYFVRLRALGQEASRRVVVVP